MKNGLSTAMALPQLVQAVVMSEKLHKFIQAEIFVCVIGLLFEIEIRELAVRFGFGIRYFMTARVPYVPGPCGLGGGDG